MTKYVILEGNDYHMPGEDYHYGREELQEKVNKKLEEGYSLYGNLIWRDGKFLQAVIKDVN